MRRELAVLTLFTAGVIVELPPSAGVAARARPRPLAFTHVTVIDVAAADATHARHTDQTVIARGDRIVAVGSSGTVRVPPDAQVVASGGEFLIPGLWDMHVHTGAREVFFPLYLANGVTGVRDMGGDQEQPTGNLSIRFELLKQWRAQIEAGTLLGPRLVLAGYMVDGPKPFWPGAVAVGDAAQARAAVDRLQWLGVDFIKVYSSLPREAYFALADEAKKRHLPFAGHLPDVVTAAEAADAGQRSIEHLGEALLLIAASLEEKKLRTALAAADAQGDDPPALVTGYMRAAGQAAASYSEAKALAMFKRFARRGTWQAPTLTQLSAEFFASRDDSSPDLAYVPVRIRAFWRAHPYANARIAAADEEAGRRAFHQQLAMVGQMQRAGVGILAGSDAANPYIYPGFSLHRELELLVEAGLTPLEALRAATIAPARYLEHEATLGTVAAGKAADLVLLDADPLVAITNTRRIAAVVVRGRYLPRTEIERMLAEEKSLAARQ